MIPVKGYPNLYRDEQSNAIINCDDKSYNQYMNAVKNRKMQQKEIDEIKKDINEIKSLLKEFIDESRRN